MQFDTIDYSLDQRVLTITLNRPKHLNAFTVSMANELVAAFNQASNDDEVGAIVVTGAGKAFCAGMDLSFPGNVFGLDESLQPDLTAMCERLDDPDIAAGVRDTGGRVTLAIYECNKPVIAAINGAAVGIGATMTLAMDVRLAADTAKIGFVFGKLGIVPEACSSWFLPRIVGIQQAMHWTYSADVFPAAEALSCGLVLELLPAEQLLARAQELARRYCQYRSPVAVALTRHMLNRNPQFAHPLDAHRIDSLAMFYTSVNDGKEGVSAFREKRPAEFTSKTSSDMPGFFPWW
ncbi:MAG: crotonase/enoyl-CoA hydratase family protein [Woeseia sp.]